MERTCKFSSLDVVFDSYVEDSIKDGERRSECEPLEYQKMSLSTPIPAQTDRFWACAVNKEALQILCHDFLKELAKSKNITIVLSVFVRNDIIEIKCIECKPNGQCIEHNDLFSNTEEADTRIIPHLYHAASEGYKHFIAKSNDTDDFALLLFYMGCF